jgi:hypothetical protein|tara:strand:+ start:3299 stop:3679 length:381 start_codon:yes stop_codon:yes gene_type:complete
MKARSAKAKGTKVENWVTGWFKQCGWFARRQPGSGIYRDFPHDNQVESPDSSLSFNIECKARKSGLKTIQGWLGAADILVMKPDYQEPYFVLTSRAMQDICEHIAELENARKERQIDVNDLLNKAK